MSSSHSTTQGTARIKALLLVLSTIIILTSSFIVAPAILAAPPTNGSIASVLGSSLHFGGYAVMPDKLDVAAQVGLNTIAQAPMSVDEYQQYFVEAEARGMKVRVSISPSFLDYPEERISSYVSTLAQSDTVSMWYLPEEPKTTEEHEKWLRLYNIIKASDPKNRPVGLYIAAGVTPDYFRYWAEVTDVIFCGAYPELYGLERVSMVTRVKGAIEGTAGTGTSVIATPQFFDAQTYMEVKGMSSLPSGVYVGHPTLQHMRFDAYSSLMLGAAGIDWYTTLYGFMMPELVDNLAILMRELNEMAPVLASPDPALQGISYQVLSGPTMSAEGKGVRHPSVHLVTRYYRGHQYIFVASLVADPMVVQLIAPPGVDTTGYQAEVLYENRTLTLEGGTMTDEFSDFGVHIYKIVSAPTDGKKLVK
jgi:hypothetical protein